MENTGFKIEFRIFYFIHLPNEKDYACLPQLTAYMMHLNEHIYHIAYTIPMICFLFCAYYGWKGYKVID